MKSLGAQCATALMEIAIGAQLIRHNVSVSYVKYTNQCVQTHITLFLKNKIMLLTSKRENKK